MHEYQQGLLVEERTKNIKSTKSRRILLESLKIKTKGMHQAMKLEEIIDHHGMLAASAGLLHHHPSRIANNLNRNETQKFKVISCECVIHQKNIFHSGSYFTWFSVWSHYPKYTVHTNPYIPKWLVKSNPESYSK